MDYHTDVTQVVDYHIKNYGKPWMYQAKFYDKLVNCVITADLKFDPTRGCSKKTFRLNILKIRCRNLKQSRYSQEVSLGSAMSLPQFAKSDERLDTIETKDLVDGMISKVSDFSDGEKRVLELLYRRGLTQTEASKIIGVSRERVRQIQEEILRKLREANDVKLD
jgi:RNA polymerase sigma factor (sigma-70 family)